MLDKAEQLHATANHLRTNQAALTGQAPLPDRRIVPIVVLAGGSYPADALSRSRVDELLAQRELLQYRGEVETLCILNLGELEMLEALVTGGAKPGPVLARWKRSNLRNAPFWNYVLRELNPNLRRPPRVRSRVTGAITDAVISLGGSTHL